MEIPRPVLKNLILARKFLMLSSEYTASSNDASLTLGVTLLQDAVEAFLIAIAEFVGADISERTSFDQYFEKINQKIDPNILPFRQRLNAMNKMRVAAKHYGVAPSRSEVDLTVVSVKEFFREVAVARFERTFESISLIDGLRDSPEKALLAQAEAAFLADEFDECLINCRKALYLRFEQDYDVSHAIHARGLLELIGGGGQKAPYWARNQEYVDKYVFDPTDYVVLDHNRVELDLVKHGVNSVEFWNVWRLTPSVVKAGPSYDWVVRRELDKFDEDGIKDRAEYVLDATVGIIYASDKSIASARTSSSQERYHITLARDAVPIYIKASLSSAVVREVPKGIRSLKVDFGSPGLDGIGYFWHVTHYEDGEWLTGFVSEDEVDRS
jgi:hypothetical protein